MKYVLAVLVVYVVFALVFALALGKAAAEPIPPPPRE